MTFDSSNPFITNSCTVDGYSSVLDDDTNTEASSGGTLAAAGATANGEAAATGGMFATNIDEFEGWRTGRAAAPNLRPASC